MNLIFFSQLPNEALADLKETFNSADNVNIAPIDVVEEVSVDNVYLFFFCRVFAFPET